MDFDSANFKNEAREEVIYGEFLIIIDLSFEQTTILSSKSNEHILIMSSVIEGVTKVSFKTKLSES